MKYQLVLPALLATLAATTTQAVASPHPSPFSFPYATLPTDRFEVEQYTDLVPVRVEKETPDGTLDRVFGLRSVLTTELELGLTDHLELGFYFQFQQGATSDTPSMRFAGIKQRLRYRFSEAAELPVDIGIYGEIAELDDEIELDERILLERRFGNINIVANLWIEQKWYFQTKETKYIYNPTLGVSYELSPQFFIGAEYWTRGRFDRSTASDMANTSDVPVSGRHYLGPTLLFQTGNVFFSLGAYARLDALADKAVVNDPYGKVWIRSSVGLEL